MNSQSNIFHSDHFGQSYDADCQDSHAYDDIIGLAHHVSVSHPHMSRIDRAAQFSPFAALTGHNEAILESGRLTDEKADLDENAKRILDQKLQMILKQPDHPPTVKITYFEPDQKKSGGCYRNIWGIIKKADLHSRMIILQNGPAIPIDDITDISI